MHSVLFEIPRLALGPVGVGPVAIHAYGTMLALAFLVAMFGLQWASKRLGTLDPDTAVSITLGILISGVLGARALYVALNWRTEYAEAPLEALFLWRGGLAFHGGVLGGIGYAVYAARKLKVSLGVPADTLAPWLAFGYAITKVGCFLNGCCHGHPTTGGWGCQFPVNPGSLNMLTPPSHPVQLYDSAMNIVVGILLLRLVLSGRRWNGYAFTMWMVLYSVTRIVADWFRYYPANAMYSSADPIPGLELVPVLGGITEAQLTSVGLIVACLCALYACRRLTLADRVDTRYAPAFALGTLPVMGFLFGWLAWVSQSRGHSPVKPLALGIVWLVASVAVAVVYSRRTPPAAPAPKEAASEPPHEDGNRDQ